MDASTQTQHAFFDARDFQSKGALKRSASEGELDGRRVMLKQSRSDEDAGLPTLSVNLNRVGHVGKEKAALERKVCEIEPQQYIGMAFCAWFGDDITLEYYTNIILFAQKNPEIKVMVFYCEKHKSKDIMERLFSSGKNRPDNIELTPVSWLTETAHNFIDKKIRAFVSGDSESCWENTKSTLSQIEDLITFNPYLNLTENRPFSRVKDDAFKLLEIIDPVESWPDVFGYNDKPGERYTVVFDVDSIINKNINELMPKLIKDLKCMLNDNEMDFYGKQIEEEKEDKIGLCCWGYWPSGPDNASDNSLMISVNKWVEGSANGDREPQWKGKPAEFVFPHVLCDLPKIPEIKALPAHELKHNCLSPECPLAFQHDSYYKAKWLVRLKEACGKEQAQRLVNGCAQVYYGPDWDMKKEQVAELSIEEAERSIKRLSQQSSCTPSKELRHFAPPLATRAGSILDMKKEQVAELSIEEAERPIKRVLQQSSCTPRAKELRHFGPPLASRAGSIGASVNRLAFSIGEKPVAQWLLPMICPCYNRPLAKARAALVVAYDLSLVH